MYYNLELSTCSKLHDQVQKLPKRPTILVGTTPYIAFESDTPKSSGRTDNNDLVFHK